MEVLKPHCIRFRHFKVDDVGALEASAKPPVRIVEDSVTASATYAMTLITACYAVTTQRGFASAGGHKHSAGLNTVCGFNVSSPCTGLTSLLNSRLKCRYDFFNFLYFLALLTFNYSLNNKLTVHYIHLETYFHGFKILLRLPPIQICFLKLTVDGAKRHVAV
jgi:hypothetical protein